MAVLNNRKACVVMSDMAPNSSGHKAMDHDVIIDLQTRALHLAFECLKTNGVFLCKLLTGDNHNRFVDLLRKHFKTVKTVKPDASRKDSSEYFILALQYSPVNK